MLKLSHLNGTPVVHHVALLDLTYFRPSSATTSPGLPNALPDDLNTKKGGGPRGNLRSGWPVVAIGTSKTHQFVIAKPPTRKRKQFRAQQGEWYALVNFGDDSEPAWVGVSLRHVRTETERFDADVPGWLVGCEEWPEAWVTAVCALARSRAGQ